MPNHTLGIVWRVGICLPVTPTLYEECHLCRAMLTSIALLPFETTAVKIYRQETM